MRIAILGWGSLLTRPGVLRLSSRWHSTGPRLPVEFARRSQDGRLTLVLHEASPLQQTYWAIAADQTLAAARLNLQDREGCTSLDPIHAITKQGRVCGAVSPPIRAIITAWLANHEDLDGIIWTGLRPKWPDGEPFSIETALRYLRGLQEPMLSMAREYLRSAPPQIQTPVRERARVELGWDDLHLAENILAE